MAATAGLGVLLETTAAQQQQQLCRHAAPARMPAQVISKATITNGATGATAVAFKNDDDVNDTSTTSLACSFICSSSSAAYRASTISFLQRCFLCHRELAVGRDIYIYRGDRAFCSEECRCRHILVEDDDDCARVVAVADRSRRHPATGRRRRLRADGGRAGRR